MEEVAISERKRVSLCLPAFLIKFKKQGTLKKNPVSCAHAEMRAWRGNA